jgi:hypothetical protein
MQGPIAGPFGVFGERTMTKPKTKLETKVTPRKMLVVFGLDENKKPRAAQFKESEFELARKAAELMGLSVYETDDAKIRRRLKNLPQEKVYMSGWGFVPPVRQIQFDNLLKTTKAAKPKVPEQKPQATLPSSWDSIGVGDLVLGQADSASDGFHSAIVRRLDGEILELEAVEYKVKVFRHRSAVALLFTPDFVLPAGESVAPGLPTGWNNLTTDHLVLAPYSKEKRDGYYEAIVVAVKGDDLTLKWRDIWGLPNFKRNKTAVALLNPTSPSKP